ncbi:type II toxin-antitoxin system VapC family toxin [Modestobacter altitudinis]|uniref:type II toxin-antitoxin system VapC family toxin n=1 Tax=Modestobacter altitudinis TaxID=2213158 RepID=UPI00110D12EB|nr:type II toxin-antitoxin system VapC family toxin [Modestobacter altitudinis]
MILYLDTSALVPLLVTEASSLRCRRLWDGADLVLCSALGHVEACAALARTERSGRLSQSALEAATHVLADLWSDIAVVQADELRLRAAAAVALRHGLRGYDAVHCAAALSVADEELVAASGDQELLSAWRADGLAVVDTNA